MFTVQVVYDRRQLQVSIRSHTLYNQRSYNRNLICPIPAGGSLEAQQVRIIAID